MAWIETESLSFVARHEAEDTDCAQRTLDALEDLRLGLEERFDEVPGGITVIIHPTPGSLAALRGTAERLYVQVVLGANNHRLPPPWGPRRFLRYLKWTWLIEGAAQYYAGQVPLFRAAVSTRLRESKPPAFPPSPRDAIILGGTIFDLLERERGPDACDVLASRLRRDGPRAAIELAFGGRFRHVEQEWRSYLRRLAERRLDAGEELAPLGAEGQALDSSW